MSWRRRFAVRGVFWRQLLRWGVLSTPIWIEPAIMACWSFFFSLLWTAGRRGVMRNLTAIKPGSSAIANLFRTWIVFWNFAWNITDTVRFKEARVLPDWEFAGREHFDALQREPSGAIILTAHMGNYDLGAHLFAEVSGRQLVTVRAPEGDPETQQFEQSQMASGRLKVDFSTRASELAFDLLEAVRRGEIVAIQGDRMTAGIGGLPATLFGKKTTVPAGPFALAMAAHVPIYPLFIFRLGRRRYRLLTYEPIVVKRTRNRDEAFAKAVGQWTNVLESAVAAAWFQWFAFEAFSPELER